MKKIMLSLLAVIFSNITLKAQLNAQIYNANVQASCSMYDFYNIDFSYKIAQISGFIANKDYCITIRPITNAIENVQLDIGSHFIPIGTKYSCTNNAYHYIGSSTTFEDFFIDFTIPYNLATVNNEYEVQILISQIIDFNVFSTLLIASSKIRIVPASEIASPFVQCNNSGTIVLNELYNDYGSTVHWSVLQNGNSLFIGDGLVANYSNIQKGSFEVKYHLDFAAVYHLMILVNHFGRANHSLL